MRRQTLRQLGELRNSASFEGTLMTRLVWALVLVLVVTITAMLLFAPTPDKPLFGGLFS